MPGSSSLKFCVYRRPEGDSWSLEARGQIDGIGTSPRFTAKDSSGAVVAQRDARQEHRATSRPHSTGWPPGCAAGMPARAWSASDIASCTAARPTSGPVVVTPQVIDDLRALIPLAPLHQPYNLAAIEAVADRLPGVPQVACFDTSFHRTQPGVAQLIPLPLEIRQGGVQRYGFHGLSYEYIASVLPQVAPEIANGRVIVAHLGSGASLCALSEGGSVDSTLGFTALDGLCMGTRPGAVDPGVILYLFQTLGLSAKEVETILYKKSGLIAISGISNDMRDLLGNDEPAAALAVDYFVYRVTKEIGALTAVLGGLDGLVFTAGIGENSAEIRRADLPGVGVARHRPRSGCERRAAVRASRAPAAASRPGSSRPTKN